MSLRKPDFHLQMPAMSQTDLQFQPRSPMRSPRFREDFDAPFSEAFLDPLPPQPPKTSYFVETKDKIEAPPQRSYDDSWVQVPKRRESVNEKVLQWAKRSLTIKRQQRPARLGDGFVAEGRANSRASRRISGLPVEAMFGKRSNSHAQPPTIITVAEIQKLV
ncbi:hypothetical protein BBK36DRAFT_1122462 [Trichoderma citrinoviride]|uniref:Uncharacterized protein n=1 Tax=Trichoderma citrinoviride TaxID=58853 RepID=A0A2T4B7U0_9HYPO|nr:hypothetical protein BBK36DRAFT_1122462 [Trichoderma citrinoviride]PTB65403.1 hypothetical protein BBK36DRAFT_1122462 [Trichoderma citrinoviride]